MSDDTCLESLLLVWQEEQAQGRDVTAELCSAHPDLAPVLAEHIRMLRQMNALLAPADGTAVYGTPGESSGQGTEFGGTSDGNGATSTNRGVKPPSGLPGYEILGELGRGGMGVVYKARQTRLRRTVALKMIRSGGHANQSELQRFRTEAEAIARLQHPNIVQIYEVGEHDGLPYFSLEFCAGGSLEKKLAGTPQSPNVAAALVENVARAIQVAHDNGVIHRDLKPANILLVRNPKSETRNLNQTQVTKQEDSASERSASSDASDSGLVSDFETQISDCTPKITDFGLAKKLDEAGQTHAGSVMGTPSYMAPEQASGLSNHLGPACDIYALGAILYEMLTGRPPFKAATAMDTLMQVARDEPVSPARLQPKVPKDLETICLKCLRKEPDKRYGSALELAEDLERFRTGNPVQARPTGSIERSWRWCRRNPAVAASLLGVALALLTGTAVSALFAVWANDARIAEADLAHREGIAKNEAEARALSEKAAKVDADQARQDAEQLAFQFCVATGEAAARSGDHALALLWSARGLQLAKDNPNYEELYRIRIANWLRQVCLPEGTFAVPGFRQNQDRFRQFQFSPDGNYLVVVASTGDCLVWDRRLGKLAPLPEAVAKGTAAAWQPHSNLLAVAEKSGVIHFLAAPDFRPSEEVTASGSIDVLAFSRDGKLLAWGGSAGARIWDRDKKAYNTPLLTHGGRVVAMSFDSTGDMLATACRDGTARVFRVSTEQREPLFPPFRARSDDGDYSHTGPAMYCPRFAAGDQVLLTAEIDRQNGDALQWRSPATGKLLASNWDSAEFAVSEQGDRVATLWREKGRLLDAVTAKALAPIPRTPPGMWSEQAIFAADGKTLVTCSHDTRVRFWSVEDRSEDTLSESYPAVYHPMLPVRVGLTANSRQLAAALWDGNIYLWRLPSGPPIAYLAHAGGTTVPALSPDKKFVMPRGVSYREGNQLETRVFDAETGKPAGPKLDPGGILLGAAFSPDGTLVATASSTGRTYAERNSRLFEPDGRSGNVQIWDWKTGKRLAGPVPMPGEPRGLTFHPDGGSLAVVCADYYVLLIDPKTGKITRTLDPGVRSRPNNANQWLANGDAQFSPDGRFLVTCEMGPQVHVWEPNSGKLLHKLPHTERVHHVAFHPTAPDIIVTSGTGSDARVWNLSTGKLVVALKHPQWVDSLRFSPDGKELFTAAADGLLRSWDWQAGTLQDGWQLHRSLGSFRFTVDRRWLVSIGGEELQVTDWSTKTPVSPRWKTDPRLSTGIEIPAGDRRVILGGFSPSLVGYDLETMVTPIADRVEDLVALVELAAGRRILNQGNVVPLNSAEWLERWERVRHKGIGMPKQPVDADRQESQAWFDLGRSLHQQDLPAAIDAYTKCLNLDGQHAQAWRELGLAQQIQQNRPAAADAFKKALALDPKNAASWFDLGNTLRAQDDLPAAVNAYKEAIAISPKFAEAHCNLGHALKAQGEFVRALGALQKGHDLGSRRADWPYPSAGWITHCYHLMLLENTLHGALKGQAIAPAAYLSLADFCVRYKQRYGDAVRLYAKAFADESKLPRETVYAARYQAASAAILAAAGKGADANNLPEEEKFALRRQALDWLNTDLSTRRKLLKLDPLAAVVLQPDIEHWHKDGTLADFRDGLGVASLPKAEEKAWHELWAEVEALAQETRDSYTATKHQGTLTAGRREQTRVLAMSAGKTYAIDMESSAFDTYLRLEDGEGKVLDENDDISLGINLNSRIIFSPKSDGIYRIVATSFARRGIGTYALTIRVFPRQKK